MAGRVYDSVALSGAFPLFHLCPHWPLLAVQAPLAWHFYHSWRRHACPFSCHSPDASGLPHGCFGGGGFSLGVNSPLPHMTFEWAFITWAGAPIYGVSSSLFTSTHFSSDCVDGDAHVGWLHLNYGSLWLLLGKTWGYALSFHFFL